jgi:hypothetical protein
MGNVLTNAAGAEGVTFGICCGAEITIGRPTRYDGGAIHSQIDMQVAALDDDGLHDGGCSVIYRP